MDLTHDQDFLIKALWSVVKRREASRRWKAANPDKVRGRNRRRNPEKVREHNRRRNPEKMREASRFYRLKNLEKVTEQTRRYREANPEKVRERSRRWREANTEKVRENNRRRNPEKMCEASRRWQANNPEKACVIKHRRRARKRKVLGDFTAEQFKALCAHFHNRCLRCGRPRKMTPDHVIPLAWADRPEFKDVALGDVDNIQPLCRSCNSSKNATMVDYRTNPHQHCINPPEIEDYLL
jgi:hypothetical protein